MPFLLPPPEFKPGELSQMGLTGTCELQICRSAGPWSMGTPDRVEHSIQNAYLKGRSNGIRLPIIESCATSHTDVRTFRVYREPVFHHIVSSPLPYLGFLMEYVYRTVVNEVKVENKIGDALVHRIIRAFHEGTPWKCCVIIPLLPGFAFPVDHSDASAVCINQLEC